MSWSCCKDEPPDSNSQEMEMPVDRPYNRLLEVPVAYILKHEEDEEELREKMEKLEKLEKIEKKEQKEQKEQKELKELKVSPSGRDDDVEKPCGSIDETLPKDAGTQTSPNDFIKSPRKITLEEILVELRRIQITMDHSMRNFEQRLSYLERVVLKMRNAWIHHRTCRLEGLEYDDEQDD